ncbi:hypothetical protein Hanom_Chr07g00640411 [Helianthus anomalus]
MNTFLVDIKFMILTIYRFRIMKCIKTGSLLRPMYNPPIPSLRITCYKNPITEV